MASILCRSQKELLFHHTYLRFRTKQALRTILSTGEAPTDKLLKQWEESSGQRDLLLLKSSVDDASAKFDQAVKDVSDCQTRAEKAQKTHDDLMKSHSNLLMRREQWDTSDAESFVKVTAAEVEARAALNDAREALRKAESQASLHQAEYMDSMRQRYHEEHLWSEKWRMVGTYGTWGLIGLNSLLFIGTQLFHQQRESKRIASFEELIKSNLSSLHDSIIESQSSIMTNTAKSKAKEIDPSEQAVDKARKEPQEGQHAKENVQNAVETFDTDKLLESLHGPSVALGAVAGGAAVVLIGILFKGPN